MGFKFPAGGTLQSWLPAALFHTNPEESRVPQVWQGLGMLSPAQQCGRMEWLGRGVVDLPWNFLGVLCKASADSRQEQPRFLVPLSLPSPVHHNFSQSQRGSCQKWDELQRSQVATGFNGGAAFPQTGCVFERFSPAASVALQHLGAIATNYLTTTHCTPSVSSPSTWMGPYFPPFQRNSPAKAERQTTGQIKSKAQLRHPGGKCTSALTYCMAHAYKREAAAFVTARGHEK